MRGKATILSLPLSSLWDYSSLSTLRTVTGATWKQRTTAWESERAEAFDSTIYSKDDTTHVRGVTSDEARTEVDTTARGQQDAGSSAFLSTSGKFEFLGSGELVSDNEQESGEVAKVSEQSEQGEGFFAAASRRLLPASYSLESRKPTKFLEKRFSSSAEDASEASSALEKRTEFSALESGRNSLSSGEAILLRSESGRNSLEKRTEGDSELWKNRQNSSEG